MVQFGTEPKHDIYLLNRASHVIIRLFEEYYVIVLFDRVIQYTVLSVYITHTVVSMKYIKVLAKQCCKSDYAIVTMILQ